jgi:hypothetical protein
MNKLSKALIVGACAFALLSTTGNLMAQGRGGFGGDPAQRKQDTLDNLRDQMEVKDDAEWTAIAAKLGKAYDARTAMVAPMMRAAFRGGGMRRNRDNAGGDDQAQRPPRRNGFGEPMPTLDALQKAIDDKAPSAEIKAKLAAYRADLKDRQAKFDAAQEDLRSVLTARQEAIATVNGLLQ